MFEYNKDTKNLRLKIFGIKLSITLILNKHVIYLDNLTDEYSKNRGMILEDNYEILMPGDKVKTYKELEEKIIDALTVDSTSDLRNKTLPLLHKYCDNKSCERIYEIMKGL